MLGHKLLSLNESRPRSCGLPSATISSAMPNIPIATGTKPMPSASSGMPRVMRGVPVLTSMPTRPSSSPTNHHRHRLFGRAMRQHHGAGQPEHHQAEILGGVELQRERAQRHARGRDHDCRDGAGDERRDRRDRQCSAGAALLRHLVAVDTGDNRRGFSRAR